MMMSLFSPVDISPSTFAAMAPALQTEAIRLMDDRGLSLADMASATGVDAKSLLAIGAQRHQVRAFEYDRVDGDDAKRARAAGISRGPKLSPAARMLLGHMHHNAGVLAESLTTVSYDIGISEKSARAALQQLKTWGFVEKTRDGTGRVAAHYRVTGAGEALTASLPQSTSEEAADA